MESYNKLVRDKIPEILDRKGVFYEKTIVSEQEYEQELTKKLNEEVQEFLVAGDIEELADVIEVIEAIKKLPKYNNLETIRQKKFYERGGFDGRFILKGQKS